MSHKASLETFDLFISTNTTPRITVSSYPKTLKIHYTSLDGTITQMKNTPANVKEVDKLVYQIYGEVTLDIPYLGPVHIQTHWSM